MTLDAYAAIVLDDVVHRVVEVPKIYHRNSRATECGLALLAEEGRDVETVRDLAGPGRPLCSECFPLSARPGAEKAGSTVRQSSD